MKDRFLVPGSNLRLDVVNSILSDNFSIDYFQEKYRKNIFLYESSMCMYLNKKIQGID